MGRERLGDGLREIRWLMVCRERGIRRLMVCRERGIRWLMVCRERLLMVGRGVWVSSWGREHG